MNLHIRMKAAQIRAYGGKEVVEINEVPVPAVKIGRVLVEVRAASVNPIDWKIREGHMKEMLPLQFPATMGMDFSGTVKAIGRGVKGYEPKEEVYGQAAVVGGGTGAFAEMALADPKTLAHKPKNSNHLETASLPLAGVSALQAITEHMQLKRGQRILIHGGAGGIGSFAIQIAKYLGAYAAATASGEDSDYVKQLGADIVIDYKTQKFEDWVQDYDFVFDTVGDDTYERSFKVLKKGGLIVSMREEPQQKLMERYGVKAIFQSTGVTTDRLSALAKLVETDVIKTHIDKIFPLEETAEALEYLKTGHPNGKVVIEIISS